MFSDSFSMALTSEDIWQKFDLNVTDKPNFSQMDIEDSADLDVDLVGDHHSSFIHAMAEAAANSPFIHSGAKTITTATPSRKSVALSSVTAVTTSLDRDADCFPLPTSIAPGGSAAVVPDIGDILALTNTFDVDINMDGGIDMEFDHFLDDILSTEPLKHDCMWSGGSQPAAEDLAKKASHTTYGERLLFEHQQTTTSNNRPASAKSLSCFDTPLSSETSDLDETSSDLEAEVDVVGANEAGIQLCDRLQPSSSEEEEDTGLGGDIGTRHDFAFSDHCYYTMKSSKWDKSSNQLDSGGGGKDVAFSDLNGWPDSPQKAKPAFNSKENSFATFRIPTTFPPTATATGSSKYRRVVNASQVKTRADGQQVYTNGVGRSPAKFKFQMRLKTRRFNSSRSLLRQQHSVKAQETQQQLILRSRRKRDCSSISKQSSSLTTKSVQSSSVLSTSATHDDRLGSANHKLSSSTDQNRPTVQAKPAVSSASISGGVGSVHSVLVKRDVRDMHNSLERQRRIDLRNAFDTLKRCVPDLCFADKASKLVILTKATDFCRQLMAAETQLKRDIASHKLRRQTLVKKLRMMQ